MTYYETKFTGMEIMDRRESNGVCGSFVGGKKPSRRDFEVHAYWAVMCAEGSSR
jgi:hypothetical protein